MNSLAPLNFWMKSHFHSNDGQEEKDSVDGVPLASSFPCVFSSFSFHSPSSSPLVLSSPFILYPLSSFLFFKRPSSLLLSLLEKRASFPHLDSLALASPAHEKRKKRSSFSSSVSQVFRSLKGKEKKYDEHGVYKANWSRSSRPAVAIVHGYLSSTLFMEQIEESIKETELFYQVLNLRLYDSPFGLFPSKYNILTPIVHVENDGKISVTNTIVEHVLSQLKEQLDPSITHLHLLGHSMGGLVWRSFLKAVVAPRPHDWLGHPSPCVTSLIQLATPNNGTKVTEMILVEWVHTFQEALLHLFSGQSFRETNRSLRRIGKRFVPFSLLMTTESQLNQMKPNSPFIKWVNAPPTYTDVVPQYLAIGQRNVLLITNLAWLKPADRSSFFQRYEIHPNDGLVAIDEAIFPGVQLIDLGEASKKLSHRGICNWKRRGKAYQTIKEKVLSLYREELLKKNCPSFPSSAENP